MLNVSNDFNEAYKNYEREIKMRIKIDGVMYTDHDISSFSVDYGSFMGNSFGIGSTFTNSMKLTLCKVVEGLKQLDEVVPEMGIVMPDKTVEYVPLGVFVISEEVNIDRNDNKTVIECSDRMILMNEPYESKLKYPAPIRDVALEIANLSGMEVDKTSFSTIKRDVIDEPKNYTYREALGLVAQFMAGYMTFDRNGLLTIRYLVDKDYRITPKEYMLKGLEKNEIMFRPSGIEVRTGQNEEDIMTVGKQKGSVIKLENTVMRRLLLDDMYTRIKDINFYPYTLKWRGNPAVEVGDWLRVTDTKGNVFKVPNLSYRLEYRGGLIATSTVETVASNEVKMGYRGVLDQTIHYVNNILEDGTGNHIYYGVEKPEHAKEGDTWFKKNGPDTEIYIYQKIAEPDVFDWVLQISSAVDDTIKEAIEELEKEVQEAKDKADEVAVDLVDVQKDADEAKASAEQSKLDAQKALAENEVTKVEAQKAKEQSDKAIKDASSSMLTAKDALSKATENETSIGGLQVDIDKTNNELKTKANQSDLNTLKGTVTNQQTQITQNATDIKTKAEKTYVDTINNKVDKQQTQINQNSESIKLKAEKQEVTNLKNEIDSQIITGVNILPVRNINISEGERDGFTFKLSGDSATTKYIRINNKLFKVGFEYVLSFKIKKTDGSLSMIGGHITDGIIINKILIDNNKKKVTNWSNGIRFPDDDNEHQIAIMFSIDDNITVGGYSDWFYIQPNRSNWGVFSKEIISDVQLELGNVLTGWKPALEDMASADQVKDISASLEVQAGKIEMKADQVVVDNLKNTVNKQGTAITQNSEAIKLKAEKSQVDSLTGKVDKQQTEINQNAEQIKLKANQSTVNDINNKVTNQQAQINLNSENIKLKAEKSEVNNLKNELDGLEIGGTNLLKDSKINKKTSDYLIQTIYIGDTSPKEGESYTISIKGKMGSDVTHFPIYNSGGTVQVTSLAARDMNAQGVYTKTFKWKNAGNNSHINIYNWPRASTSESEIEWVKLEKGNRATDWSPAPEDLATQSDVTKLEASINVEAGKITNLTSSVNKNSTNIGKLTIESNKISSQVVELQNQEIGGTNLFTNTSDKFKKITIDGWNHYPNGVSYTMLVEEGQQYIVRAYIKNITSDVGVGLRLFWYSKDNKLIRENSSQDAPWINSGKSGYFVIVDTAPSGATGLRVSLRNNSGTGKSTIEYKELKVEKGNKPTAWSPAPEDLATQSQITQLSDDILLRVQKGDVINQINLSTEGVLIQGKKVHITGQTKIDNAVIKDAMIASLTASKLTAGTINANEIAVINVKADNIVSGTLNGIYINLDKTMTIATNGSIVSSYLYGEPYGETFNARWFDGTSRYGNRYMNFLSNVYDVNSNNTQGKFRHYTETFFGSDILKMRQYTNSSNTSTPISHLDVTANALFAGAGWKNDFVFDFPNGNMFLTGKITTYSLDSTWGLFTHGLTVAAGGGKALQTGRIDAPDGYSTLLINSYRTDMAGLGLTKDRFYSEAIYNKTYSSGPQVCVTSAGTLGRVTSAAKYKLDIETPDNVINNAFKMLEIEPKMWFDKHEVETIAEAMSDGNLSDLEMEHQLRRHYGFIADDFHDKGLTEVVTYDEKGEIEGLQYDRISMYHNVILKRQQDEIETLKRQVAKLIGGGKHE